MKTTLFLYTFIVNNVNAFFKIQVNGGLIAVATPRELQEMDISLLLELPAWLVDECELDILSLNKDVPDPSIPPFLVIQSSSDKGIFLGKFSSETHQDVLILGKETQPGSPQSGVAGQSGRGASVVSFFLEIYLCGKLFIMKCEI